MPQSRLHVMSVIMFGLPSIIAYSGCGYYDEAFDRAYEETVGECPPNENTEGGCKYVFDCVPELSWTWTADNGTACSLPEDPPGKLSGKCEGGECKTTCVNSCECSSDKPCGEVQCETATCNNNSCVYTPKVAAQDDQPIPCKLAGDSLDGYCNSMGTCVECYDSSHCTKGQGMICFDSKCIIPKPQGSECKANAECESGFCADDVCCNTVCNTLCKSCKLEPFIGTCIYVPRGSGDESCEHGSGCSWNYGEPICKSGNINGQKCSEHKDCLSKRCKISSGGNGTCMQNSGACASDAQCYSGDCSQDWPFNNECVPTALP